MKKNSKAWLAEEAALKRDAMVLLTQSRLLREDAEFNYTQIQKLTTDYPDEILDHIDWNVKEEMQKKAEYLIGKLKISREKLNDIEIKFEELRIKTNALYGEEILKKSNSKVVTESNDVDIEKWNDLIDDPANWWKKL